MFVTQSDGDFNSRAKTLSVSRPVFAACHACHVRPLPIVTPKKQKGSKRMAPQLPIATPALNILAARNSGR
jgi:hypothetical protein